MDGSNVKDEGTREMNNKPVAWMQLHDKDGTPTKFSTVKTWEDDIPLYTHPAEHDLGIAEAIGFEKGYKSALAKTLTDEEIEGIARANVDGHSSMEQLKWFARAILRKAQKK